MIMLFVAAGCKSEEVKGYEDELSFQEEVRLPIVEWPGVTQKTYVISEVLDNLGYDTTIDNYSLPVILEGMQAEDLDAFTGTWFQTWGTPLHESLENGEVIHISTQLDETNYGPAVPKYVFEAGITSLDNLYENSDKFNYTYYGLEAGNDGNQLMIDAFDQNIYNLGGWDIIETNTAAMLTEMQQKIEQGEWVVFSGWEPHWMNVVLEMEYLDDPKGIWGEDEEVGTIVRRGLKDDDSNLYKFFSQFDINNEIQNEWIYEYSKNERDPEIVAKEWVESNLDLVKLWVDGMYDINGENAQEVIKKAYK
ncbi:glycine/betaine ABC transporter substrate-binding protein [Natranaerobius trueperi]|uniref:Glycine/betaine ABC transporter substrate-binding protein n=2 Tax=Natranaerobius trueperi TaxID=759412 RepID=A0A226BXX8_9FIRM|nr:glycine/betaine ABC transporter substrate-binding protein [Natranaerobius trueperi]